MSGSTKRESGCSFDDLVSGYLNGSIDRWQIDRYLAEPHRICGFRQGILQMILAMERDPAGLGPRVRALTHATMYAIQQAHSLHIKKLLGLDVIESVHVLIHQLIAADPHQCLPELLSLLYLGRGISVHLLEQISAQHGESALRAIAHQAYQATLLYGAPESVMTFSVPTLLRWAVAEDGMELPYSLRLMRMLVLRQKVWDVHRYSAAIHAPLPKVTDAAILARARQWARVRVPIYRFAEHPESMQRIRPTPSCLTAPDWAWYTLIPIIRYLLEDPSLQYVPTRYIRPVLQQELRWLLTDLYYDLRISPYTAERHLARYERIVRNAVARDPALIVNLPRIIEPLDSIGVDRAIIRRLRACIFEQVAQVRTSY